MIKNIASDILKLDFGVTVLSLFVCLCAYWHFLTTIKHHFVTIATPVSGEKEDFWSNSSKIERRTLKGSNQREGYI